MIYLRSTLYWLGVIALTPIFGLIAVLVWPLPPQTRYFIVTRWTWLITNWLRLTCKLNYVVEGREHIPNTPAILVSKHQSAWETMQFQQIFPPQVWVMKRELLWLPFFGWGLASLSPIAINRAEKSKASRQLLAQGRDRIKKGFWVVIYPEGTRIPPGQRGQYKHGAARLAADLHVPLVPVAHNAGEFWPKGAFIKHPGTITVVIGPPIEPQGRPAPALMHDIEHWIESQMDRISGVGPAGAVPPPRATSSSSAQAQQA